MGRWQLLAASIVLVLGIVACRGDPPAPEKPGPLGSTPPPGTPNILLILVDDLGYADLGVTGSEIRTPNIDELARRGVLLTDFHVTPVCFATRAALLTGVDHHTAGLGAPTMGRARNQRGHDSYAGQLSPRVATIAERLRQRGYHTYMTGKWDLGTEPETRPHRRGFERSWTLLDGGASHFSDGSGLVIFQRGAHYQADGQPVEPPPGFYSSTFYTDQMIRYLGEQPADGRPFFAYAAYTAPHWPLQVPDAWLNRYAGAYDAGYEALREQRLERMKALGLVPADTTTGALPPHVPAWATLRTEQQRAESRRMEIYAAMVELLDQEIGRLIAWLDTSRFARDTLVVFLSDNGPEGNSIDRLPLNRFWIPLAFDNSPENLGRENSYTWYGAGWAGASATPFRLYKAYPSEGGYRLPAILSWPATISGGRRDDAVLTVTDLTATLLDAAGVLQRVQAADGKTVEPLAGRSFWPRMLDPVQPGPNAGRALSLEQFGRRAVRRDQWKVLNLARPFGTGSWELFDLARDPAERTDQSRTQPELLAELVDAWNGYAHEVDVVLPDGGEFAYADPELPANPVTR